MDPMIELRQALEGADLHPEIVEIQEQPAGDDDQPAVDGAVGGLDEPEEVGAGQDPVDGPPRVPPIFNHSIQQCYSRAKLGSLELTGRHQTVAVWCRQCDSEAVVGSVQWDVCVVLVLSHPLDKIQHSLGLRPLLKSLLTHTIFKSDRI